MSILMNLNPGPVLELLSAFETYFAGRMHRLIVVGLPKPAMFLKDAIWPLIPDTTRQKVQLCSYEEALAAMRDVCAEPVACRIEAAMMQNRDSRNTLEERRPRLEAGSRGGSLRAQ